ncbi:flagellar assembly peptidoglycan hydrolase FlgJ [Burkholderiaceae bacterium DAT-1]|nr:flagellar assembly peptidoglycan hydrolase FlgJ [Burkholderiaceae bacterium DAT-1]
MSVADSQFKLSGQLAFDTQSVGKLKSMASSDTKAANRQVAQQFEALFMNMMLKAMRQATPSFDGLETNQVQTWRGMHDQQMMQTLSERGVGFASLIERQLNLQSDPSLRQVPLMRPPSSLLSAYTAKPAIQQAGQPAQSAVETPEQFVSDLGQSANGAAQSLGVSPHLLLAHAALETGWGKKPIRDQSGRNSFNLFGIKATPDWNGKTADVVTTEYVDGVAQRRIERFRAYDSYGDAFNDYARLLQSRYGKSANSGGNVEQFASGLQQGGYATDPHYARKLAQVAANPALNPWRMA